MPLIDTININSLSKLFIWDINENEEELRLLVNLNSEENNKFDKFKSLSRRKEYLATRAICQKILGKQIHISNNTHGKPFLVNSQLNISISHSKNIACIILSECDYLSLDIEYISDRVKNIAKKFLSYEELKNISNKDTILHLYQHWCTKECLIKLYGKKDINLTEELFVEKFSPEDKNIKAFYIKEGIKKAFVFNHKRFNNHILVWCKSKI